MKKPKSPWFPEEVAAWDPPEDLTVSECADKYRVLSYKSEKRGPWETSFNPVSRAYMDAFGFDCVQEIWLVKPSQSSGTEGILNMLLYAILQDPGSAMIVEPNENLADELSQERMDDMIRSCDKLHSIIRQNKEETGKKKKTFASMTIYFAWAGSPTSLASRAIRFVFFDEPDKYPPFAGKEASPIALGKERTNTFRYTKKIVYASTPTTEAGYIFKGEAAAEARFRFFITCPHCGEKQTLKMENLKFGEDHTPKVVEGAAWYECEKCAGIITEDSRMELVRRGEWVDMISGLEFHACLEKLKPRVVGFQFNRLYTPWFSFGMVAAEFLRSKEDPALFMNFKNSWMAEPWVERHEQKTEHELMTRCIDLPAGICPADTVSVVSGLDPGQGGIWFTSWAWLRDAQKHLVDYGFLSYIGTDLQGQIRMIRKFVFETRYQIQGGGFEYPVWRCGMDTGGGRDEEDETMTQRAYEIIRRASDGKRLLGTKGRATNTVAKVSMTVIDKMPGKQGRTIPGGLNLWLINTDAVKDSFSYFLSLPVGSHGAISFHQDIKNDFIRHILAEEKQKNRRGQWEWVTVDKNNHLLDCSIIAIALGDKECWGGVEAIQKPQRFLSDPDAPPPEIIDIQPIVTPAMVNRQPRRRIISRGIE